MSRWRYAALALVLSVGCLDPLVSDEPGYSRLVLPAGTKVPSADSDADLNGQIDAYDGVDAPLVDLRSGFADGNEVRYWDFGEANGKAVPGFFLAACDEKGQPKTDGRIKRHPLLVDSVPGDRDYSPLRLLQAVCVTEKYDGELITSPSALDDAIDIGIVKEPNEAAIWVNCPVVAKGVSLDVGGSAPVAPSDVFYRGVLGHCVDFAAQEGEFARETNPTVANVYELSRRGDAVGLRVIFSIAPKGEGGVRAKDYTPLWKVVNVTLASDASLEDYTKVSDFAVFNGKLAEPANEKVLSIKVTDRIVDRPLQFVGGP
jgi:hypothetical protein